MLVDVLQHRYLSTHRNVRFCLRIESRTYHVNRWWQICFFNAQTSHFDLLISDSFHSLFVYPLQFRKLIAFVRFALFVRYNFVCLLVCQHFTSRRKCMLWLACMSLRDGNATGNTFDELICLPLSYRLIAHNFLRIAQRKFAQLLSNLY